MGPLITVKAFLFQQVANPMNLDCIYFNMLGNYVGSGYAAINKLPSGIYIQRCEDSYKRFNKL